MLAFKQRVPSGGVCPRNFVLDYSNPEAPILKVGNQDSQNVTNLAMATDGTLSQVSVDNLDGVCPNVLTVPFAY